MKREQTRREKHGKPPRYSSAASGDFKRSHAGALKRRSGRRPTPHTLPPYQRPSRKPDAKGKRKPKKRGFLKRTLQ